MSPSPLCAMPRGTNSVDDALEHEDGGSRAVERAAARTGSGAVMRRAAPAGVRASPAVITLPVTSTPDPPRASSGPASASSIASDTASASRGETLTRSAPKTSTASAPSSSAGIARGELFWVTTSSAQMSSSAASIPCTSLPRDAADHADQPGEVEGLLDRVDGRRHAGRVVRGVDEHGRAGAHPLQAARASGRRRTRRGPSPARSARSPHPAPRNASTAASAVAAFCAWWAPNSGRKTSSYSPPRPCRRTCCPPTATRRSRTPNSVPSRATTASTSTARRTRESSAPGCWWASTAIESALMIPAFSPGDRGDVGPEVLGVVQRDRRDDGDPRVGDVGGVPGAAHADLDDGDVDRRVGEQRVGHAHHDLEEAHRVLAARVDHLHVRGDVVVGLDEALGAHRLAVEHDPLPDRLQVRAGEPAHAQAEAAEQLVDHARRRRLAVGAGHLDDRHRAVRRPEQVDQGGDAGQRRLEPALRPAGQQLPLDPGHVTGAAAARAQDASGARPASLAAPDDAAAGVHPVPRRLGLDHPLAEREQPDGGQLERGHAERDADDREAEADAGDDVDDRQPPAGDQEPEQVADRRGQPRRPARARWCARTARGRTRPAGTTRCRTGS